MAKAAKKSDNKTPKEASNIFHNIMAASVKDTRKSVKKCPSCGKKAHDFEKEEAFDCIPPKDVLIFGEYHIDKKYRNALYNKFPNYNTEEVVGSYLGHNPYFPSQEDWLTKNK